MKVFVLISIVSVLSVLGWFIWAFIVANKQDKEADGRGNYTCGVN